MLRHYDRNWSAIIDKVAYKDCRLEALDLIKDQGGDKSPKYDVTKDKTLVAFVPTRQLNGTFQGSDYMEMNRKLKLAGVDTLIEHIDKEELETKRIMSDRRSYNRFVCQSLDHKEWLDSKRK